MTLEQVGQVLKAARLAKGWRLVDVADRAGMSHSHVANVERGRQARHDRIEQVASVLGYEYRAVPVLNQRGAQLRAVVLPVSLARVLDDVLAMPEEDQQVLESLLRACLSLQPRNRQLLRDQAELLAGYMTGQGPETQRRNG